MINQHNITAYIAYLYSIRYPHQAVPDEVIASWKSLNDTEINQHLHQMYAAWGWDDKMIQQHELAFSQKGKQANKPLQEHQTIAHQPKRTLMQKFGWLVSIVLVGGSFGAYQLLQDEDPKKANHTTQNSMEVVEVTASATAIAEADPIDIENAQKIATLINLENQQQVAAIIMMLTPNVIEYKKIPYPSEEEIFEYYYELYTTNPNYNAKVLDIKNKGNMTYQVKVQQTLASGKQTVNYTFTFDADHKIIRIKG